MARTAPKKSPILLPEVTVSDDGDVRHLHLGTPWIQGSMRVKEPFEIELEYVQRMMAWLLFMDDDSVAERHAMQLGLGAGAITKFCHKKLRMCATAIELNPQVVSVCRAWFKLPHDGPMLRVVQADAGQEIRSPEWTGTVDALAVDLYDDNAAAPVLDSADFYADCRALLTDLVGRRVRVSSSGQADFVEALGAMAVFTDFSQVAASMQSGAVDCAVTGTLSGNTLGLHRLSTHLYPMPLTWGLAIFAANRRAWEGLPPDLRTLLRRELPRLEASIWEAAQRDTAEGIACNTGARTCAPEQRGDMALVPVSAQDDRQRQTLFATVVLPRWLQRCGRSCAQVWNQTIGPARGLPAPTTY
ncbi:hypothetical protein [Simplicispira metamorpha]|nr:hypothetical protein [Simplicispira metamorpha]